MSHTDLGLTLEDYNYLSALVGLLTGVLLSFILHEKVL